MLQADRLVMVVFWAEWCEPCVKMFPVVEELATEHAEKVKFARLNIDDNDDIAGKYKISIIPTVMFFKHRQKFHEMISIGQKRSIRLRSNPCKVGKPGGGSRV